MAQQQEGIASRVAGWQPGLETESRTMDPGREFSQLIEQTVYSQSVSELSSVPDTERSVGDVAAGQMEKVLGL